jgi:hypothetical protein
VQEEFDEAIIRLHIPNSFYGDPNGWAAMQRVEEVKSIIRKPNIKIQHSHNLLSTNEVIDFLNENTINCYFYDYLNGAGLASSPDYALATNRPIAVTKSHQLRNFLREILPEFEDIIFISDVGEIPDLTKLDELMEPLKYDSLILNHHHFVWNVDHMTKNLEYG